MDPEEGADAVAAVRASRHVGGDLEVVLQVPRACVDDTEDDKVLRLDVREIVLVGDAESATRRIVDVVGVDGRGRLARASQIRVGVADVAAEQK